MKNLIFSTIVIAFAMVSCNTKNKQKDSEKTPMMHNDTTKMPDSTKTHKDTKKMHEHSKLYSCPMHPEVQGKLNDKCSKCGMELNVEVK